MSRALAALLLCCSLATAAEEAAAPPSADEVADLIARSQAWLLAQQQEDGSFFAHEQFKLGITFLAIDALLGGPGGLDAQSEPIRKALGYAMQYRQRDGGFYDPQEGVANYNTSVALMVLSRIEGTPKEVIEGAQRFLIGLQNTDEKDINYGGIGYGSKGPKHEDLSNTAHALQALRESGVPADDPAMQRALQFLERCQNLSEFNDMAWAGSDGSAVYSPEESKSDGSWTEEEQQQAVEEKIEATGRLKGYGSMTYALISSYLYLDLKPDDPRVQAARAWVLQNYRFDVNPGMREGHEKEGLFYYYQMMAKTFDLLDARALSLPDGAQTDWRADLFETLRDGAQTVGLPDGTKGAFWINEAKRWGEGVPNLTTCYVLKALKRIHESL